MQKKSCVIFDLDGTLCEIGDSVNPYNHTWEEIIRPEIYEELVKEWYPLWVDIIILTGRKEKEYWLITRQWLESHDIIYEQLIMQEWSMAEKNEVFKKKKLIELMKDYRIAMVYDDNPEVEKVCQRLKIPFYPCY